MNKTADTKGRVLVTGATGFIGSALVDALLKKDYSVRCALRGERQGKELLRNYAGSREKISYAAIGAVGPETEWAEALADVDAIVHLAGCAHVMRRPDKNLDKQYREINLLGTQKLCRDAASSTIKRFIFVSTIKVNGEKTLPGEPITAASPVLAQDTYSRSKWEAECVLADWAGKGAFAAFIVRAPVVYGPGVRGNFLRLLKAVERGVPLPLGLISNKRSVIALPNLIDFIVRCLECDPALAGVYFPSDRTAPSTTDLLKHIYRAFGKKSRLLPVPGVILRLILCALGRGRDAGRLIDSFVVDSRETMRKFDWHPETPTEEAIASMVKWYRTNTHS